MNNTTNYEQFNNKNINEVKNRIELNRLENMHMQNKVNNISLNDLGIDKAGDMRIKLAIIDNYEFKRNIKNHDDPLDIKKVVNMKTGNVVIRYIDSKGGVMRDEKYAYPFDKYPEPWQYFPEYDTKYPEQRTLNCYNHDIASEREMIPLTHAFLWTNDKNWCGMNYLPPVGSVVIIGYRKNNLPIILGFLQTNFQECKPYIKPGETLIKGYGNNYTHWRWSDKMDHHVWSVKDTVDVDDPYKKDLYPANLDIWVRYDTYTKNVIISVEQKKPDEVQKTSIEIKPDIININSKNDDQKKWSKCTISAYDYLFTTQDDNTNENTSIYINPQHMQLSTKNNDKQTLYNITPDNINISSDGSVNMDIKKDIYINSKNMSINSDNININGNFYVNNKKID